MSVNILTMLPYTHCLPMLCLRCSSFTPIIVHKFHYSFQTERRSIASASVQSGSSTNQIIGAADMISDLKKKSSLKIYSQPKKKHHREKTRELSSVVKYLHSKPTAYKSTPNQELSFRYFRWLNPLLVRNPSELNRRLEGVETLTDINVKPYTISNQMTKRLFFWAKMASPRVIFSRFGRELIQSHEKTREFKRCLVVIKTLEKRLHDPRITVVEKKEVERVLKENRKEVNLVLSILKKSVNRKWNSSVELHDDDEGSTTTAKAKDVVNRTKRDKFESIISHLKVLDKNIDIPALKEELDGNLKSHPCFSPSLMSGHKNNIILNELIRRGCSLEQLVNGITIILYDHETVIKVFDDFIQSVLYKEWKDHPLLLLNLVYEIESLAGFCKKDSLFGGAVLFTWKDMIVNLNEETVKKEVDGKQAKDIVSEESDETLLNNK